LTRLASYLFVLAFILPVIGILQAQTSMTESRAQAATINIGLLLPDSSHSYIIPAAERAIDRANKAGGYRNQEFRLLVRTAEGFWGAGSKESVSLVYEDHVRAIVGSLDGRNGHLAEQVATKSHLSYIETYATEPTLSQAFVPWFMRVVPNDDQQARIIIDRIEREGSGSICILSNQSYDTRYAVKSLTRAAVQKSGVSPRVLSLDTFGSKINDVVEEITGGHFKHLIIPFDAEYNWELIKKLRETNPDLNIYGTLHFTMGVEKQEAALKDYEGIYILGPHLDKTRENSLPDIRSAYLYDAVNLVIEAIRQVGTDRVAITDYIAGSTYSGGVTGMISFDDLGNRQHVPSLLQIQNGIAQ